MPVACQSCAPERPQAFVCASRRLRGLRPELLLYFVRLYNKTLRTQQSPVTPAPPNANRIFVFQSAARPSSGAAARRASSSSI